MVWLVIPVPADGVKGKTWGPSTVHQRSRTQLPLAVCAPPRPRHARFCSSAPELPPAPRPAGNRRSGSHDDLRDSEPRRNRFLLCPMFTSTTDLPNQYDTVFDVRRKGSHGEVKRSFLKSIRSNSLAGLLAVAGNLSAETTELLRDE